MLESIRTLADIPPGDDVVLTRESIELARYRRLLLLEAKSRAKAEVKTATEEADLIRRSAFREGYSEGVILAATDIGAALIQSRALIAQLREELGKVVKQLLGDVLMHEQLLDTLLERWMAEQPADPKLLLQIVLPSACKLRHLDIQKKISALGWPGASVSYHDQSRYLFRLADQVMELDIDATQERLAPQILARLKSLPESVRELEYSSANVLIKLVETLVGSTPQDQLAYPSDEETFDESQ
ncbi:hypothetical protein SAMN05660489_05834 [Pseudomonas sp. LAMO17WK12:I10]|uniref:hypothetical protein n=1 Tax=unclassified Pseudomonas TaxID=196821 RepID=UPI000BCA624B|nr:MULTISPECIES: hypothetical protein [unclassified Pseudomonas]PXX54004.1 hypothetical protein H160_05827 [Pseudomonas sp. LAMO17WK12:I9]SNY51940.1 hypothetical protein SAMN05660489_05834 [Pseudomonas sp. LAMO17WK12:I10]